MAEILGVSNSFTGAAQAIEIAGDFAYGYSGEVACGDDLTDMLSATTGNFIFVGHVTPYYFSINETDNMVFEMSLNETVIARVGLNDSYTEPWSNQMPVIIPPYTKFAVQGKRAISGTARNLGVTLTGRIYR